MTNETIVWNDVLLTAAKVDCQKRTEREQKFNDLKQLIGWFLIFMALLMVGLRIGYPELFSSSIEAGTKANTIVTEIENNIVDSYNETQNEVATESTPYFPYSEPITEEVTKTQENIESKNDNSKGYNLSEADIGLLTQAIQHETLIFREYSNYDTIQQLMAASIVNRLGVEGFGANYTTAYTVNDLLSNTSQYENILWELDGFDAYDFQTRQNIYAVLNGTANTPAYLYYERCSYVGEDYWSAQESFYSNFPDADSMNIVFMELSPEGRYIMFAVNPYGAYAY